jgi:VWFA-related protein
LEAALRARVATSTLAVTLTLGVLEAPSQEPPSSFPSGAEVVVLDVVATDSKGRPFTELRKEDLQVSEDGHACEILSFRLVRAPSAAPAAPPVPAATSAVPTPPGAPTPTSTTPARPSLVVLVFDRLTAPYAPLARKGALDLMARAFPPDTWFAVFKVGYGTRLLTPFTTDTARLRSSIEAATAGDADVRGSRAPGLPPVKVQLEEQPDQPVDPNNPPLPDLRPVATAISGEELLLARRTEGYDSLYAVLGVARALSAVEGRKSLVYFAEGWHLPTGTQQVYDDAISAANRANVAVHTVDARGLTSHKPLGLTPTDSVLDHFTADQREGPGRGASTPPMEANGGLSRDGFATRGLEDREMQLSGPTLQRLADDTGGLAIADTNDLGAGLAAVAEELRQYYEVVYAPANPAQDGRFRRIRVRVSRSGVRLRTRAGYFATPTRSPTLAAYELPLMDALAADTPAHDFPLQAAVLHFASKGRERECVVLAEVPLSDVRIASDPANSAYRGHLALLGYVKDEADRVVARLTHDWSIEGPLGERDAARARNALFRRTLPLAPGRYVLSVAVQDRQSGSTSVTRTPFEVQPTGAGLSLGSVALLERASRSAGTPAGDPLRVGDVSLVPRLGAFTAGSSGELPIFVPVYPAREAGSVELIVELRREGKVVAEATPELPRADATGRIPWIGTIPAAGLRPGDYELTVTAKQGGVTASERSRLVVVPGPKAEARPAQAAKAPDPALAAVLERAGRYVVEYEEKFRNLVAEEHYTQKAFGTGQGFTATATAPVRLADGSQLQTTRADLVFVHLAGDVPWGLFRDVFEVNGNKVHDRDERLEKLFRERAPGALEQAGRILRESARYNIGPQRTVNLPTLALLFLHPRNQPRFRFEAGGRRRFGQFEGIEVAFDEVQRPTITSGFSGGSVPASGRFWIDESRGAVLRSEIRYRFEPNRAVGLIATEYRAEPRLGLWVPVEMTERYEDMPGTRDPVFRHAAEATARYSNFRQFSVSTDEKAALPPE